MEGAEPRPVRRDREGWPEAGREEADRDEAVDRDDAEPVDADLVDADLVDAERDDEAAEPGVALVVGAERFAASAPFEPFEPFEPFDEPARPVAGATARRRRGAGRMLIERRTELNRAPMASWAPGSRRAKESSMPSAVMEASSAEPPEEMNGSGTPMTGSRPVTTIMFTKA